MIHIETTPQTDHLRRARALLAALADATPGLDGLPAVEALAYLDMVVPPYPPVDLVEPGSAPVTEAAALEALGAAVAVAADPQEAVRIVRAVESLTTPILG